MGEKFFPNTRRKKEAMERADGPVVPPIRESEEEYFNLERLET